MKRVYFILIALGLVAITSFCSVMYLMWKNTRTIEIHDVVPVSTCMEDSFSIKDFVLELHIQNVQYPDVILRQACLESGWFTSLAWRKNHNPFGFVGKDGYIMFNDWKSAIAYMCDWQDKHYKGGEYYRFLEKSGYAQDCCYVETLKNMDMNNLKSLK